MITRILFFVAFFLASFVPAQQHEEFKMVKSYFENQKQLIFKAFNDEYKTVRDEEQRAVMRGEFSEFIAKMDSVENYAYINALIKVKNLEDLKAISGEKTFTEDKTEDSKTDKSAEYPGGFNALRQQLAELIYSENLAPSGSAYRTVLRFMVERDGSISSVEAAGENPGFNTQAMVAVYLLPDRFSPAALHGVPVRARFSVPVTLKFD